MPQRVPLREFDGLIDPPQLEFRGGGSQFCWNGVLLAVGWQESSGNEKSCE